ncbi:MAG: flagellar basal body rod protein FlgB [Deltaproteobacteria bacterium]|nr:flagellar basal body rod protein FlgB [Deltaproteobacteria bacterium]
MGSQTIFSETISVLENVLNLRSFRHNQIISNVANKDTPNYKAFDLAVEEELEKLMGAQGKMDLRSTHPGHLATGDTGVDNSGVTLRLSSNGLSKRGDGNTVDVESEMANLAENSLLYDAMAQIIRKKFQGLKVVIQGGGK